MLVLSRKAEESVIIAGNVTVTVLGIQGNQVRFGINAPKDIPVHREEIYNLIQEEARQQSSQVPEKEAVGDDN